MQNGRDAARDEPARRILLELYRAALTAVGGRRCVADGLVGAGGLPEALSGIAIGKAAAAMCRGAMDALGPRLPRTLAITKYGHGHGLTEATELIEAGHPTPDGNSLLAGRRLLEFIADTPAGQGLVFLISGGASALVEVLPEGVELEDLARVNAWLLGSGLPIDAMNRVRKSLSCIKGGRLARHLHGRPTLVLLISDVPGNDPAVIGSGLLAADPDAPRAGPDLPAWIQNLVGRAPPAPRPGDPALALIPRRILADNRAALEAARAAARARGFDVHLHEAPLSGDAAKCGRDLAAFLREAPAGVHLWGGETTVRLPREPGRGGRNQHLGLAAAEGLEGAPDVCLLAAATDGSDGPTEDAGALVDGGTLRRGREAGLDAGVSLRGADAGRFLEASGDLLQTGPTGTNVMDLVIALKRESCQGSL